MTVGLFITHKDGIEVYSDGAAYDQKGVFGQISRKVATLPDRSAMIFARGSGTASDYAKSRLALCPTFDDMVLWLPVALSLSSVRAMKEVGDPFNLGIVLSGFSEADQEWQSWRCGANEQEWTPDSKLEVVRLPGFYAEPWPDDAALIGAGLKPFDSFEWDYTLESALAFMEAVRASPQQLHPGDDATGCLCGAFVERTILKKDICHSEIVRRWPDKLGERLNA